MTSARVGAARRLGGPARRPGGPARRLGGPARRLGGPARRPGGRARRLDGPARRPGGPARWGGAPARWGGAVALLAGLASGSASAADRVTIGVPEPPAPADELDVRLVPDLVLTLGMFGVASLLDASKADLDGDLSCPEAASFIEGACDRELVNPVDRWAAGLSVKGAAPLSDVLLVTSLSLPFVFAGLDTLSDRASPAGERLGKDALVVAQTYAATYLFTTLFKIAVQRLRPYNYNPRFASRRGAGDSRLSFPSGHSSMAFAGAATLSVLLEHRFPGEPWAVGMAIGGFAVAATTATLRVLAGRHFPTDVIFGAAVGTAMGLLIPNFHRGPGRASVGAAATPLVVSFGGRF